MSINLLHHNIQPYADLVAMLAAAHKAMVVAATGAGKTSVALKYLEDHNLNALVVCPKRSICRQWEEASDRVKAITYQKFCNLSNFGNYGCYIFDEAHHAGAPRWSIAVKRLMTSTTEPVIGLTADPKRYLDHARDMGQELWDGNVVYGVDLDEAIQKGVLPNAIFVCTLFDGGEEFAKYRNLPITDKLKGRLETSLRNCLSINDALHKHMPPGQRKGVVFVDSIDCISQSINLLQSIYPFTPIFTMHSKLSRKTNSTTLEKFNDMEQGFIVTVDMLNEGVHTPGVNTIIMLRRTSSPNIFMQQIGRGISPTAKDVAIFDFVGNNCNLKIVSQHISQARSLTQPAFQTQPEFSTQFIAYDYATPVISAIEDIKAELSGEWTEDECNILRTFYPTEGNKVTKRLPGRTVVACGLKARELGVLTKVAPKEWTKEEDDILRTFYPTEGKAVWHRFPNRTDKACVHRAQRLGLTYDDKSKPWAKDEILILTKYYFTEGRKVSARLPGRTKDACMGMAHKLGLNCGIWTENEDNILRTYYPQEGAQVVNRLPGRTRNACLSRAAVLGVRYKSISQAGKALYKSGPKWTNKEDNIIRIHFPQEGGSVAQRLPGRSEKACLKRAAKLNVQYAHATKRATECSCGRCWTEEENDILQTYYPIEGSDVFKRLPGRTKRACLHQTGKLGIRYKEPDWTEIEDSILRTYYPEEGAFVSKRLPGRTESACVGRCNSLGIRCIPKRSKPWEPEEDAILRKYYPVEGMKVAQRIPNRTERACKTRVKALGIS